MYGFLERSQIEFSVPTRTVQPDQIVARIDLRIQQGCSHDKGLYPKSRTLDPDAYFPDGRDYACQKACIEEARIPDKAREQILGLNALRLLGEAAA